MVGEATKTIQKLGKNSLVEAEPEVGSLARADQSINYLSSLNMLFDTATLYPKEDVSSSSSSLSLLLHRFCVTHPIAVITRRAITPEDNFQLM